MSSIWEFFYKFGNFAALIASVAAFISAFVAWQIPMLLRKEKYKEILYQRKFAVYEETLSLVSEIFFFAAGVEHFSKKDQALFYKEELLDHQVKLKRATEGTRHFFPGSLEKPYTHITNLFVSDKEEIVVQRIRALKAWVEVINIARDDLGVDKLSKEIHQSIGINDNPFADFFKSGLGPRAGISNKE